MARYKYVDRNPRLLPVDLEAQLVPGTFAHALHHVIDELDFSAFIIAADHSHATCPAGQRLYRNGKDCVVGSRYKAIKFRTPGQRVRAQSEVPAQSADHSEPPGCLAYEALTNHA